MNETKKELALKFDLIKEKIELSCHKANRSPSEITLLPVTKTKPIHVLQEAFSLGYKRLGENKVQEAREKSQELQDTPIDWCFIGHLQTNKVRYIARFASEVHSLDRLRLAVELEKRLQIEGRSMDVLIQVNSSDEPQKYGLHPDHVLKFAQELKAFSSLKVKGLMTLALFSENQEKVRKCFKRMYELRETLRQKEAANSTWDVLSMGMSGDYEMAIEEGATEIRLGQALFGPRELPDSHYWP